jgi:hypothetical protein
MGFQLPTIGIWYRDQELDTSFEVVALDENSRTIEVQYVDGAIGEFDFESWQQLALKRTAAPEDSEAAYEMSYEDKWSDDSVFVPESWINPVTLMEPEGFQGIDDF